MDHGRGLISCGQGGNWYAPGAVTVEAGSVAAQIGGEKIDIVDPIAGLGASLEEAFRSLHDRFGLAWDEKSAQADPSQRFPFSRAPPLCTCMALRIEGRVLRSLESTLQR